MKRVAIITNVLPSYRKAFYQELLRSKEIEVTIYCQSSLKGLNLNLCHEELANNTRLLSVISMQREMLAWQNLPIMELVKEHEVFVFYGNPRVISNVVWASLLRLLGKNVAIWGQAHTAGSSRLSESVRLCWWRLFRNILVYNDNEVTYLRDRGFIANNIVGINNGLNQKSIEKAKQAWPSDGLAQWRADQGLTDKKIMLSCSRLEEKNQFDLVLDALIKMLPACKDAFWCVIGDGREKNRLQALAAQNGLSNNIRWVDALYEEEQLAPWFLSAELMVHPAAIGLSLLHAFGYGLPVVTHDNGETQMPEFAAMEDNCTGYLYREGSVESLAEKLLKGLDNRESLAMMGEAALVKARTEYNTEVMKDRFLSLVAAM